MSDSVDAHTDDEALSLPNASADAPARRSIARLLVQVVGFCIGLALLGWAVTMALGNKAQLERLLDASPQQIAMLLGLSLATLIINGLIFWAVLLPVRRVRILDMQAVNGIATSLTYLPFKLSALVRVAIHNRRDHVPLLTIGSWFAAIAILMLAAVGPAALAAWWFRGIGAAWLVVTLLGQCSLVVILVYAARAFRGTEGQLRLARLAGMLRVPLLNRLLSSRAWTNLHAGFDMIASPGVSAGATALRLADLVVHVARFWVAATVLGVDLPIDQILFISLGYFLVGVLSPFGVLGAREGGAIGVAAALYGGELGDVAGVALLVTATETVVYLFGAAAGLAWLRPDRLLRVNRAQREAIAALHQPAAPSGVSERVSRADQAE